VKFTDGVFLCDCWFDVVKQRYVVSGLLPAEIANHAILFGDERQTN
jgi:hypothetical protein